MGRDQRLGLTVGAVFGLVFVLVNAGALPSPWPLALRGAGVLALVGVLLALRAAAQRPAPVSGGGTVEFSRGFRVVAAVEVVALIAGVQVVARVLDVPEAGVAWVSVVVGLHFVALAVLWRQPSLHVLGGALAACGLGGLALALAGADEPAVATVGGVVPGFVLLAGAAWAATVGGRVPQDA